GEPVVELLGGDRGRPVGGRGVHHLHLTRVEVARAAQDALVPRRRELSAPQPLQGARELGGGYVGVADDAIGDRAGAAQGERHGQELGLGGVLVEVVAVGIVERGGEGGEAGGESPALLDGGDADGLQVRREGGRGGSGLRAARCRAGSGAVATVR